MIETDNWLYDPEVSYFDTIPSTTFIGFDSPELATTLNTQAFQHGGRLNNFSSAIETGSIAQNLAAEPGFLSTAAGQQLLLKGGLMLAQMVLGATGATGKPKQPKREPLDPDKAKKIRNEAKNRHGLKRKKKKKEDEGLYS